MILHCVSDSPVLIDSRIELFGFIRFFWSQQLPIKIVVSILIFIPVEYFSNQVAGK